MQHDKELGRVVRIAKIFDAHRKDLLVPLRDAVLIAVGHDTWSMTGWERIDKLGIDLCRDYTQSWILNPLRHP